MSKRNVHIKKEHKQETVVSSAGKGKFIQAQFDCQ